MARPVADIFAEIDAEKAKYAELNALDSPSQSAVYRRWMYITATAIHYFERLLDLFKGEMEETIRRGAIGNADWYVRKAFEFQLGDDLTVTFDGLLGYAVINPEKRIIKRASALRQGGVATLKVATEDGSGNVIPLNMLQLNAFTDYINNIMFAGSSINVVSLPPDLLDLKAEVYYNPLFFAANVQANVISAVQNYLRNLPFDGVLRVSAVQDAIQAVEGVTDVRITTIRARANATPSFTNIVRTYLPVAGYIDIDPAFPLATSFTLLPE